ncbi:VOC family protein [Palleronia rufa]|uniref:VOC family protein n=1 Tax=Palleronia rufa TaxID=1530186 RepID=UPI000569A943|nr:VOC family protein [Palleronia rufa]
MTTLTRGVHHVGLTVPDCRATADFFIGVLGFAEVSGKPDYPSVFVSDGHVMLTLWQAEEPAVARAFDRKGAVGLHHLALSVADADALAAVHERLAARDDVAVEFAPEAMGGAPLRHLMCAIPGGVRVEFVAPADPAAEG